MLGTTLVHESNIFCSDTERNLFFRSPGIVFVFGYEVLSDHLRLSGHIWPFRILLFAL